MHSTDVKRFRLDENFVGWGGEDADFYSRVSQEATVVREEDKGFVHMWHGKDCYSLTTSRKQFVDCVGSVSTYLSSKLGYFLQLAAAQANQN